MNIDLTGYNALVSGSTQGIGRAIAAQFAESGAAVTLMARNEGSLKQVLETLPSPGGAIHSYIVADFSDPQGVKKALQMHLAGKAIHIVVNNTGGPPAGKAIDANIEEFRRAFEQHLICNQVICQFAVQGMIEYGYGRIINVISTSVKQPLNNLGVSNTIRGAVANWSKTLANELAPNGITVNNLLPGATETERLTGILKNKSQQSNISVDEARVQMLKAIPAGRFGKPEELAYAAAFLASPLASYITGTNLVIDGGRTSSL